MLKAIRLGLIFISCLMILTAGFGVVWGRETDARISRGTFQGHEWRIDKKHMLWWDEKPCVPFTTNQIWIDYDKFSPAQYEEHFKWLDHLTSKMTRRGEIYYVLFGSHPLIKSITDLGNPSVKARFVNEWRKFAPAIMKEGLRAVTVYNEINAIVPTRIARNQRRCQETGAILNDYAKTLKEIMGNIPVLLKIVGDWNIKPIMAAIDGDYIDGLGGDFFSSEPDPSLIRQMNKPLAYLEKFKKTKLFWITEFARVAGEEPHLTWPPFKSRSQMKAFMDIFISKGATGFFYFPYVEGGYSVTRDTIRWFDELQPEALQKIMLNREGAFQPEPMPPQVQEAPEEAEESAYTIREEEDRRYPAGTHMSEEAVVELIKERSDLKQNYFDRFPEHRLRISYLESYKVWRVEFIVQKPLVAIYVDDARKQVTEIEKLGK